MQRSFLPFLSRMGAHSFGPDAVRPRGGDRLLGRQDTQGGLDRRHCSPAKHLVFRYDHTSFDPSHESGGGDRERNPHVDIRR